MMSASHPATNILAQESEAPPCARIRLLVVDDHPVVRLGLNALLSTQSDMEVVALAESGEAALQVLMAQAVDVVLLDLRMPGVSGVEMLERIRASHSAGRLAAQTEIRVLIISSFEYDEEIYTAVGYGVQGFVHKEAPAEQILSAIRAVACNRQAFPKHIRERLAAHRMTAGLSSRQLEILELVAKGLTNKEVAQALNLSQFTVRNQLSYVMQKLDATDRTEAIFNALQTGLISPP